MLNFISSKLFCFVQSWLRTQGVGFNKSGLFSFIQKKLFMIWISPQKYPQCMKKKTLLCPILLIKVLQVDTIRVPQGCHWVGMFWVRRQENSNFSQASLSWLRYVDRTQGYMKPWIYVLMRSEFFYENNLLMSTDFQMYL